MKDEDLLVVPDEESFLRAIPREGERARPRRRHRILYPLLALLVFVSLGPLSVLAWRFVTTNRETLATTQQENQLLLVSSIAAQLDSHIDGLTGRIEAIAGTLGGLAANSEGTSELEATLAEGTLLSNLIDADLVSLTLVTASGRSFEAHQVGLDAPPELESAMRQAVRVTLKDDGPLSLVSDPLLLGDRAQAAVVIATPIFARPGGPRCGVLAGLVDISKVWEAILDESVRGQVVYALDGRGRLFGHTEPALVARRADLRGTELVGRFLAGKGGGKETMLFSLPAGRGEDSSWLGSYESTRQGWGIFVQVEEKYAYVIIGEMVRATITWALVGLAVAAALGMVFASRLSQPVRLLTDAARRFAQGDFASRADVTSRNEIGELGETFNQMADDIAVYIRSLQQAARENNELFLGTIRALSQAIDAKDPYTRGHSARVAHYSAATGRQMNLQAREMRDLYVSALLHDIGKIGIEDAILKKPASLTADEFEIMKGHPDKGARIMAKVDKLKAIIPGMRHHHERYGGGGYPLGLKGEEIPLAARIINVADSFDAMTTDRPYSRAMTFEASVARLIEISGTQVDPVVVAAFRRAWESGALAGEERKLADKKVLAGNNLAEVGA